jgi:hypothetical protein
MNIETKFNLTERYWTMVGNRPMHREVLSIRIEVLPGMKPNIMYGGNPETLCFHTKDELLDSMR